MRSMILDGHIHIGPGAPDQAGLKHRLSEAGIGGGILISQRPAADTTSEKRLANLVAWCRDAPDWYPFFWIDPMSETAMDDVAMAVEADVLGFKIICGSFFVREHGVLKVLHRIAEHGKPVLFHSGILWDGYPSSRFNRPVEFEVLLEVPRLRFTLAHMSWPWCDECLAVYGKFLAARERRPELSAEMFIDITPGTPPIYREEALTKLFTIGYDVQHNICFGTDCGTVNYDAAWAQSWLARDRAIFDRLGLPRETVARVLGGNLRRFAGVSNETVVQKLPYPGK